MPSTVVGIVLLVIAVLPGLVYVLAFERQVGGYGVTLADRTLRLVVVSAIFHIFLGWPEYLIFRDVIGDSGKVSSGEFAALWAGMIAIVAIPGGAGTLVGGLYRTRANREGYGWIRKRVSPATEQGALRLLLGGDPAPRAWDDYFTARPTAYLRVMTSNGTLLAGLFADQSYAAGFPQDPDLLLEEAWELDEDGTFVRPLGYPLYIAAGQISWVEMVPPEDDSEETR